jgi:hypothetical protein
MTTFRWSAIFLMLLTSVNLCLSYQTEHVVLVIIDGVRYTEGLGDPNHNYVPYMNALKPEGAIVEPFQNDGYTYTSRAIPAIWCGAWTEMITFNDPDCGGSQNSYSELPTIFEYYRQQLSRPQNDCVYVLKNLCSWKASFNPNYGPNYWPLYHTVGSTDLAVWNEARTILTNTHPSFMLLYLADVDHYGHTGNWNSYTRAITIADSIVGMVWNTLQSLPFYAGTTTMFVTNDHGRHTYDFSGHGDGCVGCRTIQLLALGPDIQEGLVSNVPRTLRDITPTIGELLGFTTEYSTGTAMTELFNAPAPIIDLTIKTVSHTNFLLQWLPSSGATSYKVYRGSTPETINILTATVSDTFWTDQTVSGLPCRFYQVTAVR